MTLREWCELAKIPYTTTVVSGSYGIEFSDKDLYIKLWHLSDFMVSSVSAGSVWLVPR
jgi:hypothetical protein